MHTDCFMKISLQSLGTFALELIPFFQLYMYFKLVWEGFMNDYPFIKPFIYIYNTYFSILYAYEPPQITFKNWMFVCLCVLHQSCLTIATRTANRLILEAILLGKDDLFSMVLPQLCSHITIIITIPLEMKGEVIYYEFFIREIYEMICLIFFYTYTFDSL